MSDSVPIVPTVGEIARRLGKKGIAGALEGACAWAGGSLIGRTHFARFLVKQGYCETVREVFKHYLVRGKPGHVPGQGLGNADRNTLHAAKLL